MFRPISDERRRLLLQLAACVCGGALSLLFLTGSPTFSARAGELLQEESVPVPTVPDRLLFPPVDVGHDPFIPRVLPTSTPVANLTEPVTSSGEIGFVLPPNSGAGAERISGAVSAAVPVIRAVVVGDSARALVERSGTVDVMQVGDAIGGSKIVSIDASGVTLASGTHLPLARDHE